MRGLHTITRGRFARRARGTLGSFTSIALLVVLVALVWSTLQTQRLVGLRQQSVELEQQVERARVRRDAAEARALHARSYDVIADRARRELGLVDSDPARRSFVALPAPVEKTSSGFVERLADTMDRFGRVRASLAAEREP
jgi:cell division protein FtsB